MKRKTESYGTTATTYEMLTPTLKFKLTTYKLPCHIITTAVCREVFLSGAESYRQYGMFNESVECTWHKRVSAPMVQSHHRTNVATYYDKFLQQAIAWNVARGNMPAPLTAEEQAAKDAEDDDLLRQLEEEGLVAV